MTNQYCKDCKDCNHCLTLDYMGLDSVCTHPEYQELLDYDEEVFIKDIPDCDLKEEV